MKPLVAGLRSFFGYESNLASWLLIVFQLFLVSVSFILVVLPLVVFDALVGWQPTHLAIALFGIAVFPVVLAAHALLAASKDILDLGSQAHAGRKFWRVLSSSSKRMAWLAVGASLLAVLISYDIALLGPSNQMLVALGGVAVVLVAVVLAVCVLDCDPEITRRDQVLQAMRALGQRPLVGLAWILLILVGVWASSLPLVGPSLMFFVPALAGTAIVVCNRAFGFGTHQATHLELEKVS